MSSLTFPHDSQQPSATGKRKRLNFSEEESEAVEAQSKKKAKRSPAKHGNRQSQSLVAAIEAKAICYTQGPNYASRRVPQSQLIKFLQDKLNTQRNALKSSNPFNYLLDNDDHIVGHPPSDAERRQIVDTLLGRYGSCKAAKGYMQTKIPCSTLRPTVSDSKNGKAIGVIQFQAYALQTLLHGCTSTKELVTRLQQVDPPGQPKLIGCHLCKHVCYSLKHTLMAKRNTNKQHDFCPAYWIINGKLVSLCTCNKVQCIRPGPLHQPALMRQALNSVLQTAS